MSQTLADKAILAITGRAADLAVEQSAPQLDWSILILPAFDLLSQLLTNCINSTNRLQVVERMHAPGFYRDRRVMQALRKAEQEQGLKLTGKQRRIAFESMCEELDATDPEVTEALLDELQADESAADWSILG